MPTPPTPQENIDAIAAALTVAEVAVEQAMIKIGKLPAAIRQFHKDANKHVTTVGPALDAVGSALGNAGKSMADLSMAHTIIAELKDKWGMPEPTPIPQGGGGGGK